MTRYTCNQGSLYIKEKTGLNIDISLPILADNTVKLEGKYKNRKVLYQAPAPSDTAGIHIPCYLNINNKTLSARMQLISMLVRLSLQEKILKKGNMAIDEVPHTALSIYILQERIRICTQIVLDQIEDEEIIELYKSEQTIRKY